MQLFFNGKIHTLGPTHNADWLLTAAGKIVALGDRASRPGPMPVFTRRLDLRGHTVVPAFTDAHTHFVATARQCNQVRLDEADSLEKAIAILEGFKKRFKGKGWIRGGGFNKNLWADGRPHRNILDRIFPNQPVALESKDFHALWLNSLALKVAGISPTQADPPGGKIGHDVDRSLNGLLYEKALALIYERIPQASDNASMDMVDEITKHFFASGITTVHSMEGLNEFGVLQKMQQLQRLKIRVRLYVPESEASELVSAGIRSGFGSDLLKIAGVKFFTDGALGSQTADMLKPYEGSEQQGVSHISAKALNEQVRFFNHNGLSVAVHAIGDRAAIKTLDAFSYAKDHNPQIILPNRMEHAQLVPTDQIKRFRKLGIVASMQPVHIADDVYTAEKYWGSRCDHAFPINSFHLAGVPLAFGSDTPVVDFNPFRGLFSAINRKYQCNPTEASWHPEQKIGLNTALTAFTIGPALAMGESAFAGSLEVGYRADFVVLENDIFSEKPEILLDTRILQTVMNAETVYSNW